MSCTVNKGKICWREINCGISKSFRLARKSSTHRKRVQLFSNTKEVSFLLQLGEKKCYSFEFHVRKVFVSGVTKVHPARSFTHASSCTREAGKFFLQKLRSRHFHPSIPSKLFIDIFVIYFFTFFHPVSDNMSLDVEKMCVGWCKWADTFINIRITSGECCSLNISLGKFAFWQFSWNRSYD